MQKGLVYNKVNPIFHHWRVDERKFGLTFQSPADAISFEKGLQSLIDKMDRGSRRRGGDACVSHARTFINGSIREKTNEKKRECTVARTTPSTRVRSSEFIGALGEHLVVWDVAFPPFWSRITIG